MKEYYEKLFKGKIIKNVYVQCYYSSIEYILLEFEDGSHIKISASFDRNFSSVEIADTGLKGVD